MRERLRPRFRLLPRGIRARTTLVAVTVVGMCLGLAFAGLVIAARSNVAAQVRDAAVMRATDVSALVRGGTLPSSIPGRGENLLVQVVDARGVEIASSPSIEGQAPLVGSYVTPPGVSRTLAASRLDEVGDGTSAEGDDASSAPFVVALAGVDSANGPVTVIVAASLAPVDQAARALVPLLAASLPLVMLLIGGTVWALTGLALRPVEAIRVEAESISASAFDRRMPVPASGDEIAHLAETMNRMLDRLQAAVVRQRQFVADASHELKSPVAAIRTMLDVADAEENGVDLPVLLEDLRAEDARLAALVSDLLTLAWSDEGGAQLHEADVDLDDVVITEIGFVRPTTSIVFETSGLRPVRLRADRERLAQLMRNLFDNAVRHAHCRVQVTTRTDEDHAVLIVSDDGPGISETDRERVFERFVRLDEARGRSEGGTGLGLAVCRAIAQAHGGEIRVVVCDGGEGAAFEVRLPLSRRG